MANTLVEDYTKTYTSYSGCDIVASFNGKVIGELQAITYSVSREKAPVYTMGSAEPRSFSRGKRGIAGTMVFTVFNRDALIEEFKDKLNGTSTGIQKFKMNDPGTVANATGSQYISIDEWDKQMSNLAGNTQGSSGQTTGTVSDLIGKYQPVYADEILPFDVTISFANEYGQRAVLVVYGVELLNEGSGYSIDSVTTEKAYTFVARKIDYMKALTGDQDQNLSATF
jgi:hypothetical protein